MKLEEYVLNKKQAVERSRKELERGEYDFSRFEKSLKFFSERGLDVSVFSKNGHNFYSIENDSFYSMVKDYKIQVSGYCDGGDFDDERSSKRNCFFEWELKGGNHPFYVVNENDFEFMKIYSVSNDVKFRDSGHYISRICTENVEHGKNVSEIIHYFLKKGVAADVLSKLEKDVVKLREDNPVKFEKRRGYDV